MSSYTRLYPGQAEGESLTSASSSTISSDASTTASFPDVEKGTHVSVTEKEEGSKPASNPALTPEVLRRRRLVALLLGAWLFFFFFSLLMYSFSALWQPEPLNQFYIRSASRLPATVRTSSAHLTFSPESGLPVYVSTHKETGLPLLTQCWNAACTRSRSVAVEATSTLAGANATELTGMSCGIQYTMEMDGSNKVYVMRKSGKKGLREIEVAMVDLKKDEEAQTFTLASPSSESSLAASSVEFFPHAIHFVPSSSSPVFVYSRVSAADSMHSLVLATAEGKETRVLIAQDVAGYKTEAGFQPLVSTAVDSQGQVWVAVGSSTSSTRISVYRCSLTDNTCSFSHSAGDFFTADSELHSVQLRIESSTDTPVLMYAVSGSAEEAAETYTIVIKRDLIEQVVAERAGDLRAFSFVLDPETEYPILLASAQLADSADEHHHAMIRFCTDLYCADDDVVERMVTLPKAVKRVSGMELAAKAAHGQLVILGKVRGEEYNGGHVMLRVDVMRQYNQHVVNEEFDEDIIYG